MIPILRLGNADDRQHVERLLRQLRLDPVEVALGGGGAAAATQQVLADVAKRGDDAIVDLARQFDDPAFTAEQIRVAPEEMRAAARRVSPELSAALTRSIAQVREYQAHVMPHDPPTLRRPGVELGMRFTPLDSAGLYFPGGKAAYPSSLIMLAVPAQVAGVGRIVVCSPPSKYGKSDLVLAACHELKLEHVFRAGGAAAVARDGVRHADHPAVDKIVGPGNSTCSSPSGRWPGASGSTGSSGRARSS
jgi:histidinol dehydrogenase